MSENAKPKRIILEVEDLGYVEKSYLADSYPRKNTLYISTDGAITNIAFVNEDGCVFTMPLPLGAVVAHKAKEIEAQTCDKVLKGIEAFKDSVYEILQQLDKTLNNMSQKTNAHHTSGVSEDALIKLAAIAQNPELIKDLEL